MMTVPVPSAEWHRPSSGRVVAGGQIGFTVLDCWLSDGRRWAIALWATYPVDSNRVYPGALLRRIAQRAAPLIGVDAVPGPGLGAACPETERALCRRAFASWSAHVRPPASPEARGRPQRHGTGRARKRGARCLRDPAAASRGTSGVAVSISAASVGRLVMLGARAADFRRKKSPHAARRNAIPPTKDLLAEARGSPWGLRHEGHELLNYEPPRTVASR